MDRDLDAFTIDPGVESRPQRPECIPGLIAIWTRVLRISPIFADSNFFDLGGDSLLALGLLLEVERETGVSLPITILYDAPTVCELAALIDTVKKPEFSPLVRLKEGEGAIPFFVVHGIGGTVMELARLGSLIQYDGPVFAIQAQGIDGTNAPLRTIEEMAEYYVDAVRAKQPVGPYRLGGYSFGGLVAVEMARRLQRAGEMIDLLTLIDAYPHPQTWPRRSRLAVSLGRVRHRCTTLRNQTWRKRASFAIVLCKSLFTRKDRSRSDRPGGVAARRWLRQRAINLSPDLRQVYAASEESLDSYSPLFYPGKIIFFRAEITNPLFPSDPGPIWRPLVQDIELHSVRGDHLTMIASDVGCLAEKLSDRLAQVSARASPVAVANCGPS